MCAARKWKMTAENDSSCMTTDLTLRFVDASFEQIDHNSLQQCHRNQLETSATAAMLRFFSFTFPFQITSLRMKC